MKYYYRVLTDKPCKYNTDTSKCVYSTPNRAVAAAMYTVMHNSYESDFKYNRIEVWSKQFPTSTARLVYSLNISEIKNYEHING